MRTITIRIEEQPLPEAIHGLTFPDNAGRNVIVTNQKESEIERFAAFLHECGHLYRQDESRTDGVEIIERELEDQLIEIAKKWISDNETQSSWVSSRYSIT